MDGPANFSLPDDPVAPATELAAAKPVTPEVKPLYPSAAAAPTQSGPEGIRFDFNQGAACSCRPGPRANGGSGCATSTPATSCSRARTRAPSSSSSKRLFVRFRVEVWSMDDGGRGTAPGADPRLRRARPRRPDPVSRRHAGRHPGLVSLRCPLRRGARLPADLRDVRPDHPAAARRLSRCDFVTHEELAEQKLAETLYATYRLGLFFDDTENVYQPTDFRHVGLHRTAGYILGVDPTEEAPRAGAAGREPADRRAVCLHRRAELDAVQVLEEPGWLARGGRVPQGQRLPGDLHRPEAGARHRPGLEPHSARRRGPDRRPSADRAGTLAAPCRVLRRPEQRTVVAGLGGGLPGGADQRLHPSDQRVHDAVPGDQLARLQQLLERSAPCGSITRTSCGARAMPARRASSSARG